MRAHTISTRRAVLRAVLALAVCLLAIPAFAQGKGKGGGGGGSGGGDLPANANLAFHGTGGLTLLDTTTGESGVLASSALYATWSPDGRRIAYLNRNTGDIHIKNSDGSDVETTVARISDLGWAVPLDWSRAATPNGREMLVFAELNEAQDARTIYALELDGSDKIELLRDTRELGRARWSPFGNQFACRAGDQGQLTIHDVGVDSAGRLTVVGTPTPVTQVPSFPRSAGPEFDWSNNGQWIVVASGGDLWIIDLANAANTRQLTFTPQELEKSPSFDASDERVYFTLDERNFNRLYSVDAQLGGTPVLESGKIKGLYWPQCRRDTGTGSMNFAGPLCVGSNGQLHHDVTPLPAIGKKSTVRVTGGPGDGNGLWVLGEERPPWRFPGTEACFLQVDPVLTFGIDYDATGLSELRIRVPHDQGLIGARLCSQFAGFDPAAPGGITLSNAVLVIVGG